MGNTFRKLFDSIFGNKEMRVCTPLPPLLISFAVAVLSSVAWWVCFISLFWVLSFGSLLSSSADLWLF
jgi:hypothetical protein